MYVGTIHVTHLSIVLKMFERKKPVLSEKPLTMNAQNTATLFEAAKKLGMLCSAHMHNT